MLEQNILISAGLSLVAGVTAYGLTRHFYARQVQARDRQLRDVSARLASIQQQAFNEKNELNAILSSMVEGVLVIATDDKVLYVSPNASGMFQLRSKDVALKNYWEVIPHQQINAAIKESIAYGRAVSREIALIGPQDKFFDMQISPVRQDGRLSSVVAVFHEITEFKRLLKLRSEFVANVSHELKTPLTSIKGYVETLQEGALEDKDNAQRFLGTIHQQTQRLQALVEDLLSLSAIESKEAKMDLKAQPLLPIIKAAVETCRGVIDAAGHQLEIDVPANVNIYADQSRLVQVFINLLDNAAKFTPKGGRLAVKARLQPSMVRVDVSDTGIGIASADVNRVFERFYRVDKARTAAASGGTGLGLSIVKHIVSAHQGRVEVDSRLGQGSTFSIYLPLAK